MPGEFYIEGKQARVDLSQIIARLNDLAVKIDNLQTLVENPEGPPPASDSVTGDWQSTETEIVSVGEANTQYKLHSLLVSIHNLTGSEIIVRLYLSVNGTERKIYEQDFNATTDPPGLPVINGSWAFHGILRATLQSNDAADNGKAVDYDYLLEEM